MATHRLPILGWASVPDSGGNVFFEPYDVKSSNAVWDRLVLIFNDTATRDGIHGGFVIPKNYVGSAKIIIVWTSTTITNDVVFDFDYRAVGGDDSESMDQTSTQGSVTVTDTAPSAIHERMEAEVSLTSGDFAVDDEVLFTFFRDGTASDTMVGPAIVFSVLFEFADA